MCGIFGVALKANAPISSQALESLLNKLFLLSESRGKESAGMHMHLPQTGRAVTLKGAVSGSELLQTDGYKKVFRMARDAVYSESAKSDADRFPVQPLIAIAHSRLVTNGAATKPENNQPVRSGSVTVVHNGIVVNPDEIWASKPELTRTAEVDTEAIAALTFQAMGHLLDPLAATKQTYSYLRGAASIAWTHDSLYTLTLATNTGDLYYAIIPGELGLVFASERYILQQALTALGDVAKAWSVTHLHALNALSIDVVSDQPLRYCSLQEDIDPIAPKVMPSPVQHEEIASGKQNFPLTPQRAQKRMPDESLLRYSAASLAQLKRCSHCILPETFPFIEFDSNGVCNYCKAYKPKYRGIDAESAKQSFLQTIEKYRGTGKEPNVLVPFSGGRDSCYGLHLIKKEFDFNPITFTYDWGMVTDLARRNIARLCGSLGVQNILVSANIKEKRENIQKNVAAWLKKPDLGMVPLFMAGDKHFFKLVNDIKRQTGVRLDLWSANPLENTDFKSGFCGVAPDFDKSRLDHLSFTRKVRMATYYLSRFASNPGYINTSLVDTGKAFLSYYMEPRRDFFFMFNHLVWNEDEVNRVILSEYDFERSPDSPSTWRIGDGTAPFYNYIYLTARGFSEFDTFRSNQIREGQITREKALESVLQENSPRTESLVWYLDTIGLDFDDTIKRINMLDKLGLHTGG